MNLPNLSIDNFFYLKPLHLEECRGVAVFFLVETLFNAVSLKGIGLYAGKMIPLASSSELFRSREIAGSSSISKHSILQGIEVKGKFSTPIGSENSPSGRYLFEQF
ncbi:MAG: hypothetical protein QNJ54_25135 [Prochloraceae cyanobacterium]|nr:hypothetical protein [Prochloraceae cyanobacterium]